MDKSNISIKGARINNLKNIDVEIPRNKFIVITGLSGSGKSSLAFDTLYAEGQRRYVESLSSYARQFLGKMAKPECDYIKGLPPAIAIEQKVNTRNPRSTVGTSTEIYDYLRLLYGRIGKTISPISGEVVKKHTIEDVIKKIEDYPEGARMVVACPINIPENRKFSTQLEVLLKGGYSRLFDGKDFILIEDIINSCDNLCANNYFLVIDRLSVAHSGDEFNRLTESIETAFFEGKDECIIFIWHDDIIINGSKKDASIQLDKKDIIWPILVYETDINRCDDEFLNQFDIGVYDEVVRQYSSTIDSCCERIEFFTRILYDYSQFPSTKKHMEKCQDFIDHSWEDYKSEFSSDGIDNETLEALTKIVIYNVIRRRITIDKVRQGVNL